MDKLQIEHVSKRYWRENSDREVVALEDVSVSVPDGEFLAIVGPSGCGKTTLLNIVAGLLPYDEGVVSIAGRKVNGPGIDRAVVFQHSSLLPWRTIAGNVRYGMELQRRFDKNTMSERTDRFIRMDRSVRSDIVFLSKPRCSSMPYRTLPAMVRQGNRLECWKTTARSMPGPFTFLPAMLTTPSS